MTGSVAGGPGGHLGIRGMRRGRVASLRTSGLVHPDSALFVLPIVDLTRPSAGRNSLPHRTLTMAMFFGISMSTLQAWTARPPDSYADWYAAHPERLPDLAVLDVAPEGSGPRAPCRHYAVDLYGSHGATAPYRKVADHGRCRPELLRWVLRCDLGDVADAEEMARAERARIGDLDDVPFYRKVLDRPPEVGGRVTFGGCGARRTVDVGERHPDQVLAAPLLAAALAVRMTERLRALVTPA